MSPLSLLYIVSSYKNKIMHILILVEGYFFVINII